MAFLSRLIDARGGSPFFWTTFAVAACILCVPLFVTDVPPVADYPNHLARMYVLANGPSDPILSTMYAAQWDIIPDLGIDLTVPWMLRFLPLYVAGRMMLAAALLLPVIGTIAYSRALFGRGSLWPLGSFLVAYNFTFLFGFINLLLSYGIAFLSAAFLYKHARHSVVLHTIIGSACAVVLFFTHIAGLALFLMLVAGYTFADGVRPNAGLATLGREFLAKGVGFALIAAGPAILYAHTHLAGAVGPIVWEDGIAKLSFLASPFLNYYSLLDLATAAFVASIVILLLATRKATVSRPVLMICAILFVAYPYVPFNFKTTSFVDVRITTALGFLVFCLFTPRDLPKPIVVCLGLVLASLFVFRTGLIAEVWYGHNQDLAALRQTIAPIEPGSRVLVVDVKGRGADSLRVSGDPDLQPGVLKSRYISTIGFPMYWHLAALVLIERRAFWPLLFADPSKQPLRVLEPYRELSNPAGMFPHIGLLRPDGLSKTDLKLYPYLADWRSHFDYVLVLNAGIVDGLDEFLTDRLSLSGQNDFTALFRVKK